MRQRFNDSSRVSACLNFGGMYEAGYCAPMEKQLTPVQKSQYQMYISQYRFDFKSPKIKSNANTENRNNFRCRCQKCSESLNDYNLQKQTSSLQRNYFSSGASKNSLINCVRPFKEEKIRQKRTNRKKKCLDRTFIKDLPQVMVEKHMDTSSFRSINFYDIQPVMTSSTGSNLNMLKPKRTKKKIPREQNQSVRCGSNVNNNNIDLQNLSKTKRYVDEKKKYKIPKDPNEKRKLDLENFYKIHSENVFKRVYLMQAKKDEKKNCDHFSLMCDKFEIKNPKLTRNFKHKLLLKFQSKRYQITDSMDKQVLTSKYSEIPPDRITQN
ncbi:hypothetical protein BpHYR1_005841 [Brachionus plicatilis]|uniref:Uncharacterized protein n=1 Tax=Brachionus plicatilis TaxID=10195 RepID=A0A3M7SDB7_BRAPC|nr:hypothetical protein BpHYR1_005841 [Brachionus plicatilis]